MTTTQTTMKRTLVLIMAIMAVLVSASFSMAAKPAHAQTTFTVDSTGDLGDTGLNGVCDANPFGSDICTLRAAIQEANHTPGADTIEFEIPDDPNVPGPEVKTIRPLSQLPNIGEAVTIDGYTQPGSSPNTLAKGTNARLLIELDGSNAGSFTRGLEINGPNSVIRGLVINRFDTDGILLRIVASGTRLEGNFIGTDSSGTLDRGNRFSGVVLFESMGNNTVGGTTPAKRNLISGNEASGIAISHVAGTPKVVGNLIGTSKDGKSPLGNASDGVNIFGPPGIVGGDTPASANTIAFNGGDGVSVGASTGNRVLRNSIFSNGGLGIDLLPSGPTPNDPGDADTGTNGLQNFPVIASAKTSSTATTIRGSLNSTPGQTFRLEFFSNPSGTDEGQKFIGVKSVTTGSDGNIAFTFKPKRKVPAGLAVTATATDPDGNTSEFSAPRTVVAP